MAVQAFYTNVSRYGNSLLYRGYSYDGKRIQKKVHFSNTLYLPTPIYIRYCYCIIIYFDLMSGSYYEMLLWMIITYLEPQSFIFQA